MSNKISFFSSSFQLQFQSNYRSNRINNNYPKIYFYSERFFSVAPSLLCLHSSIQAARTCTYQMLCVCVCLRYKSKLWWIHHLYSWMLFVFEMVIIISEAVHSCSITPLRSTPYMRTRMTLLNIHLNIRSSFYFRTENEVERKWQCHRCNSQTSSQQYNVR